MACRSRVAVLPRASMTGRRHAPAKAGVDQPATRVDLAPETVNLVVSARVDAHHARAAAAASGRGTAIVRRATVKPGMAAVAKDVFRERAGRHAVRRKSVSAVGPVVPRGAMTIGRAEAAGSAIDPTRV